MCYFDIIGEPSGRVPGGFLFKFFENVEDKARDWGGGGHFLFDDGVVGRISKARTQKVWHDDDAVLQVGEVEEKA